MKRTVTHIILTLLLSLPTLAAAAPSYPLRVSTDGRHLVDQSGTPVLFNMESGWFMLTRLTREEVIRYFDNRVAKGFNAILIMFPMPEWDGDITNRYGEPPFLVPGDFTTANEAYFEHADWVVEQAHARGLTLFLAPAYLGWECVNDGFCDEMRAAGPQVLREWGRWIGTRYRDDPNIVWVHGGDADAAAHGVMDLVDAVAFGIQDVDTEHLHTAHCARFHSSSDCYDRPWLDINATYANCQETPSHTRTNYQMTPTRPIVFIEGRYEFEQDWTDICMRSQAYWSLLGGATGQTFGSGIVHTFSSGWEAAMESEGSRSMVHFVRLLRSRAWETLVPDYEHIVLVGGYGNIGTDDYAAAAQTSNGQSILVYVPSPRPLTVSLDGLGGNTAEAWWYDPSTGNALFGGTFSSDGLRGFSPPSNQDWVLVIDDAAADLSDVWDPTTAVAPGPALPVTLGHASPNPFNPRTEITFSAPAGQEASVRVFDTRGREIAVLFRGLANGAQQAVAWNAEETPSGTYFIHMESGGAMITRKVAVVK